VSALAVVERWLDAMSRRDLEAAVACFASDYEDVTPTRPGQEFRGAERVRANLSALFAAVPDLRARVLRSVEHGDEVWIEWRLEGTRSDGSAFAMAGVNIFGVHAGQIAWGRIYTEQVREAGDIDEQIDRMTRGNAEA